jgi:hypothetical protein
MVGGALRSLDLCLQQLGDSPLLGDPIIQRRQRLPHRRSFPVVAGHGVGTATVGVLFAAARRWGVTTALLAAALLAVAPAAGP